MTARGMLIARVLLLSLGAASLLPAAGIGAEAPPAPPSILHSALSIRQVVGGLTTPISMAFLGTNDFFILGEEHGTRQTGRQRRRPDHRARSCGKLRL